MRLRCSKKFFSFFLIFLLFSSFVIGLFSFVPSVYGTELFSDGFESGDFSAWSATSNSPSIITSPVHTGVYAASMYGAGSAAGGRADVQLGSPQANVHFRIYVRFPSLPSSGNDCYFLVLWSSGWSTYARVGVANLAGSMYWVLDTSTTTYATAVATINADTWYCIELRRQAGDGNGINTLYVEDSAVINLTSETQTGNAEYCYAGINWSTEAFTVLYDCAVIADAYIGEEVSSAYPYVNNISDVDSVADVGSHGNFTAQQYGPDLVNDTLTEADTGGSLPLVMNSTVAEGEGTTASTQVPSDTVAGDTIVVICTTDGTGSALGSPGGTYSVLRAESQNDGQTTASWYKVSGGTEAGTTVSSTWSDTEEWIIGAIRISGAGSVTNTTASTFSSGDPVFPAIQTAYDNSLVLRFWGMDDDDDPEPIAGNPANHGELWARETGGAGGQCSQAATYYNASSVGVVAQATFNQAATAEGGVAVSVVFAPIINYRLELEEQFSDVPYGSGDVAEVCVYAGPFSTAEELGVQVWNGSWNVLGSLSANQWNNFTATSFVNNTDLYIRFVDGTQSSDAEESNWQIDAVYLWIYNYTSNQYNFTLSVTVALDSGFASPKGMAKPLSDSFSVTSAFASNKDLLKPLLESVVASSTLEDDKGMLKVFSSTFEVASSLLQGKALTKPLAASMDVTSSFVSLKALSRPFSEALVVDAVMDSAKSLLQHLAEFFSASFSVSDVLLTQKTLGHILSASVSFISDFASNKSIGTLLSEIFNVDALLSSTKSILQHMSEILSSSFSASDTLLTQKSIMKLLTDSIVTGATLLSQKGIGVLLDVSFTVVSVLESAKAIFNSFVELIGAITVDSVLSVSKSLGRILVEEIASVATLISQKGISFVLSASMTVSDLFSALAQDLFNAVSFVLSESFQVSTSLLTQKGLTFVFSAAIEATSFLSHLVNDVFLSVSIVLSETIGTILNLDYSLVLHAWFFEFIGAANFDSYLNPHFPIGLFSIDDVAAGAIIGGLIAGVICFALFMIVRRRDDDD